ncbi:DUF7535 family protein [Halobacterium bonnevillei]|uniref:Uncharacterized protein n=1 Tax=Halobacterium bonnevillei TaxID=2692200 RepID=A0A6B0SG48_9EURY|nr:hypothetical protein [Halobacterium bonnevillei]MXR20734.1 hypothetical protein [Halobacterium bonnevillei]
MSERADSGSYSVGPTPHVKSNPEMSGIGLAMAALLAVLLLPLLPFIVVIWGFGKLLGRGA